MNPRILKTLNLTIRAFQCLGIASYHTQNSFPYKISRKLKMFCFLFNISQFCYGLYDTLIRFQFNKGDILKKAIWLLNALSYYFIRYVGVYFVIWHNHSICSVVNVIPYLKISKNGTKIFYRVILFIFSATAIVILLKFVSEFIFYSRALQTSSIIASVLQNCFMILSSLTAMMTMVQFSIYVLIIGLFYFSVNKKLSSSKTKISLKSKRDFLRILKSCRSRDLLAKEAAEKLNVCFSITNLAVAFALFFNVLYNSVFISLNIIPQFSAFFVTIMWLIFFGIQFFFSVSASTLTTFQVIKTLFSVKEGSLVVFSNSNFHFSNEFFFPV